ncbi:protein NDNF-like [Centruroides vittatus]|uniref:protein NDNF-like n=1 Tax=Centruroides vittatus TaxID=120091 RepID=UPI00350F9BAF
MVRFPLVALLLALAPPPPGATAGDPTLPFYFPDYRPQVFYDNGALPEDAEVSLRLSAAGPRRVYFLSEKEGRPLTLTVTPCWRPVKWRLSLGNFPLPGRKETWRNQLPEKGVSERSTPLASYVGSERKIYSKSRSSAGLYVLELESEDADADVRIHVTTGSELNSYYPQLPADSSVGVLKVRRNKVLLTWKASPAESKPGQTVSYCLSVDQSRNRRSLCSVRPDASPTLPPSTGFGFSWEKSKRKVSKLSPPEHRNLTCVGRKTWHMFRGLQKGSTYYFDVFVVDSRTEASSAYDGVRVTTKRSKSVSRLKDGSLTSFSLDAKNSYSVSVKYPVTAPDKKLWIFLQSCTGPGPVTIRVSKDGEEIVSSEVMDTKTLSVVPPSNGTYQISVETTSESPRRARMWVGRKFHKLPFPVLPEDKSVKIFDTLTTCDSVTLAWHSTIDEKVKYCIYKRTAKAGFVRLFASPQNFCEQSEETEEGRERVLCRRYHRFSRQRFNNVIMQRVRNLKPSFTYVFDVRVTKHNAKTLSYERVWVTTSGNCSSSKGRR